MIKLYDFKSSPNCQRVKIVLAEKNLPYEIVPVDLRAQEQKTPDYLKLNPHGKVPVLTDDDTVLYESCIINEYLEEKYPNPPLLPKEPGKKAKARILVDYGMAHFDSPYQKLRMELMKDPKEQNQQVIDGAKNESKETAATLRVRARRSTVSHRRFFIGRCRSFAALYPLGRFRRFTRSIAASLRQVHGKNESPALRQSRSLASLL